MRNLDFQLVRITPAYAGVSASGFPRMSTAPQQAEI